MLIKDENEFADDPWDTFDRWIGYIRDALAGVGAFALVVLCGYLWGMVQ